ncbi:hypothetical protein BsWGS_05975 [Bradybaena similaris]
MASLPAAVYDSSRCCHGVQPAKEMRIEGGGCQVNYENEVVLSWVKVLLELQTTSGNNVTVSHSLTCEQWQYLNTSHLQVADLGSSDQRSSWVTIELPTPVRARCLRIFPPPAAKLADVRTSDCGSRLTSSLVELDADFRQTSGKKGEEITSVLTTNTTSRESTASSPTTTPETPKVQVSGEFESTGEANDTTVTTRTTVQYTFTNSESENNESQVNRTQYSNDTLNPNISANPLSIDAPSAAENSSTPVASTQATTTTEIPSGTVVSSESNQTGNAPVGNDLKLYTGEEIISVATTNTTSRESTASSPTTTPETPKVQISGEYESTGEANETTVTTVQYTFTNSESDNNESQVNRTQYSNDTLNPNISANPLSIDAPSAAENSSTPVASTQATTTTEIPSGTVVSSESNQTGHTPVGNDLMLYTGEEITSVATTNTTSRESTATSPTTTPETPKVQVSGEFESTGETNNTTVTTVQYTFTNSESENNESQVNRTQYSNDTLNPNISANPLSIDAPSAVENSSTPVASTQTTTTTEISPSFNVSFESILSTNASTYDYGSTYQAFTNESLSLNTTSLMDQENVSRNGTLAESSTQLIDILTNSTNTSEVYGLSSGKPPANESVPETSKRKEHDKSECGMKTEAPGNRRKRVIGGQRNRPGQWPWLVSMHYMKEFSFTIMSGYKHTCGATLVAPDWVITAAHCFSDELLNGLSDITRWRVYFGLHDLAKTSSDRFVQERLIEAVYKYPSYDIMAEPLLYDLALVKLNESVKMNKRVSPICLDTLLYDVDSQCYVSGWGQNTANSPGSRYPYTAAISTLTLSKCKEMYSNLPDDHQIKPYVKVVPSILCAAVGTNGEDACQGDSGGPLMCERGGRWYQAGIVAAGYLCGDPATPGLYTRISHYRKWIADTMILMDDEE